MAKLILSMETTMLKEIPLNKERTTIGRKPHNDIQIDNLAISGEHAVVITILNDSFLEDLGSTNGTFVNGQSVKKHFLQNGDTIELGKYRLKFVSELPQQTNAADFEKTMILRPGAAKPPASAPSPAPRHVRLIPLLRPIIEAANQPLLAREGHLQPRIRPVVDATRLHKARPQRRVGGLLGVVVQRE